MTTEVPYIAHPDRTETPPMNDSACFLDKDRGCGPDCTSFTANTPGPEYNEPWAHCLYLCSLFRIGKHLVIMAQQGDEHLKLKRTVTADTARASNGPVVPPFVPPTSKKVEP